MSKKTIIILLVLAGAVFAAIKFKLVDKVKAFIASKKKNNGTTEAVTKPTPESVKVTTPVPTKITVPVKPKTTTQTQAQATAAASRPKQLFDLAKKGKTLKYVSTYKTAYGYLDAFGAFQTQGTIDIKAGSTIAPSNVISYGKVSIFAKSEKVQGKTLLVPADKLTAV